MIGNRNINDRSNGDINTEKIENKKSTFHIEDLKFGSISGVLEVCSFSDSEITLAIASGKMEISGSNLEVKSFDTATGEFAFFGDITSISAKQAKASFFSKLTK